MVTPRESLTVRFFDRQLDRAGVGRALLDAQQHAAADHQLGQFARRWSSLVSRVATIVPCRMTETLSVIAMISRSLWVMRTIVLPCSLSCLRMRNR